LQEWLTPTEFIGFLKGNTLKYDARHRQKGGLSDLKKGLWYQDRLVKFLVEQGLDGKDEHVTPTQVYVALNADGSTTQFTSLHAAQLHEIDELAKRQAPPLVDTAEEPRELHHPVKPKSYQEVFRNVEPLDSRGYRIGKRASKRTGKPFRRKR
jgi:hypothetical protein